MRALLAVALLASPAFADPVSDTRQIMAGTVTTKSVKQAYLSGARDSTAAFQGALAAYKAVRAAEPKLTVTCADGTVIEAPGACPLVIAQVPQPTKIMAGGFAKALTNCPGIYSGGAGGGSGVTAGTTYKVITWGWSLKQPVYTGGDYDWALEDPAGGPAITVWATCLQGMTG